MLASIAFGRDMAFLYRHRLDLFYLSLVHTNDSRIAPLLVRQEEKNHRWVGGVMDPFDIHAAIETAKFIRALACVYCEPASRYFHNPERVESLLAAADLAE